MHFIKLFFLIILLPLFLTRCKVKVSAIPVEDLVGNWYGFEEDSSYLEVCIAVERDSSHIQFLTEHVGFGVPYSGSIINNKLLLTNEKFVFYSIESNGIVLQRYSIDNSLTGKLILYRMDNTVPYCWESGESNAVISNKFYERAVSQKKAHNLID